ncbi:MAG: Guanylate kinase [Chlamydiales bacterium]|nr:Guanylate kinase [Chlamydiales bacterium]
MPRVATSVSCTTRKPRPQEVSGRDYYFISEAEFAAKIQAGAFLEHVHLFGNYYGTSLHEVEEKLRQGLSLFLVIDTEGALKLKNQVAATRIFLAPPSLEELKRRLEGRRTESEEKIQERLSLAEKEMDQAEHYDYLIVNDQLDIAFDALKSIVVAEAHRTTKYFFNNRERQHGI